MYRWRETVDRGHGRNGGRADGLRVQVADGGCAIVMEMLL